MDNLPFCLQKKLYDVKLWQKNLWFGNYGQVAIQGGSNMTGTICV
jgi:hypothetical protein